MASLIIPMRFGTVSEGRVRSQHSIFYSELLRLSDLSGDAQRNNVALPISIPYEHSVSPDSVADRIKEITDAQSGDALLIDVGGPDEKDVCRPNIIRGIGNVLFLLSEERRFSKIVLFFSVSISDKDVASKFLFPIAAANQVTILFGDGTGYEIPPDRVDAYRARLPRLLEAATVDVVEKFKKKLVRHVGFFSFEHNTEIAPHLFDGSECGDEIYQILYSRMLAEQMSKYSTIYYDCQVSKWFERPFVQAAEAAGIADKIRSFDASHAATMLESNACLYSPIIRTGSAIADICRRIIGVSAGNGGLFFSLLSTRGRNGRRSIQVSDSAGQRFKVEASYDVLVPEADSDIQRVWKAFAGAKYSEAGMRNWKLSSCAAWGMILEAGLVAEKYKPEARNFVGYIPNSDRLAVLNGPLIAQKISVILRSNYGIPDGTNLVFVCPKEAHALKIVESLRELSGCSYVAITRDVIDFVIQNERDVSDAVLGQRFGGDLAHDEALKQLASIGRNSLSIENPDVVIFDEFSSSGSTLKALSRIISAMNLDTKCTICLLDLSGQSREDQDFYALYDLDYSRWTSIE